MLSRRAVVEDEKLRHAEQLLARRIFDKYSKLKHAFQAFDYNGDGRIRYGEFRGLLRDLGISFPPREFRDLCTSYDADGDKEISYHEILKRLSIMLSPEGDNYFSFRTKGAPPSHPPSSRGAAPGRTVASDAEKLLAAKLFDKFAKLRQAFRDIDRDGNGYLNKNELETQLRQVGPLIFFCFAVGAALATATLPAERRGGYFERLRIEMSVPATVRTTDTRACPRPYGRPMPQSGQVGATLTPSEFQKLWKTFDQNEDGRCTYAEVRAPSRAP